MPSVCTFDLNKSTPTYFSGEIIAGTITLQTTSDKNVRDVCIIFLGEGKVKWEESHSTTNSNGSTSHSNTSYRSHETYINNSTCVHGDGVLPAGTHTYTFNIPLPWGCPTSCEGKYGHIRYEIALKINRYYRFDNVYKKPITIIKTVDLNLNPIYKFPLELETFSNTSCWPWSKDKIFYAFKIFTAKSPHRKQRHLENILLSRSLPDKCLRLTNRVLQGVFLVPATPPTTERSSIICVEYTLKVTVQQSSCGSNPELKIPIIIGTVPIRESLPANQFFSNAQQQQVLPALTESLNLEEQAGSSNLLPDYNEIKPPTFEEATQSSAPFIDTDTDARNRIVGFRPLYPMYNTFPTK